jgi:hypothetical protein
MSEVELSRVAPTQEPGLAIRCNRLDQANNDFNAMVVDLEACLSRFRGGVNVGESIDTENVPRAGHLDSLDGGLAYLEQNLSRLRAMVEELGGLV